MLGKRKRKFDLFNVLAFAALLTPYLCVRCIYVIAGKYALLSSEAARRNPRQISHANWKDGDVIG